MEKTEKTATLIIYSVDDEVIVCSPEMEKAVLEEFFLPDTGRRVDDYDRREVFDVGVAISSRLTH